MESEGIASIANTLINISLRRLAHGGALCALLLGTALTTPQCLAVEIQSVAVDGDFQLLVNERVDPGGINPASLRAIFTMRKLTWDNNTPITVFVLPDSHPVHRQFCKSALRVYPYVLREQWDRLTFSGTGSPPITLHSIEDIRKAVANTPGAIGYILEQNTPSINPEKQSMVFSAVRFRAPTLLRDPV